jgi:hypothetical protein
MSRTPFAVRFAKRRTAKACAVRFRPFAVPRRRTAKSAIPVVMHMCNYKINQHRLLLGINIGQG